MHRFVCSSVSYEHVRCIDSNKIASVRPASLGCNITSPAQLAQNGVKLHPRSTASLKHALKIATVCHDHQMEFPHNNVKGVEYIRYLDQIPSIILYLGYNLTFPHHSANMTAQRANALFSTNMVDFMATSARVLAPSDVQRVLVHVGNGRVAERNTCIILLSFHAGLRACEIAGLEWPMLATAQGKIGSQLFVAGTIAKNGRQRTIPLHPHLVLALRQLHRAEGKPGKGPVIRSLRGGHMSARSVVNWFTKLYWELGYEGCSSHSGRRTFITRSARLIFKAGGSLKDIQELAGHSCLTTTERYIEGDREAQRKLIRLL